jgi:hypothetical protein
MQHKVSPKKLDNAIVRRALFWYSRRLAAQQRELLISGSAEKSGVLTSPVEIHACRWRA